MKFKPVFVTAIFMLVYSSISFCQQTIHALIKVKPGFLSQTITSKGIKVNTKAGNIWSIQGNKASVAYLNKLDGVLQLELDLPVHAQLEPALKSSRVDSLHNALVGDMAFDGNGVVVGIIDAGFDYAHPTFYDTSGTFCRVKRIWAQHDAGTPPDGYSYGNEIIPDSLGLKQTDAVNFSHGTHVGGIAAGSGYGGFKKRYRGVAYQSELVFVGIKPSEHEWISGGMSTILDGIAYIFNYASIVGKPAVVNISWGCNIGPKDGSSLFAQACKNLSKPGRIIVISAGNNGDEKIHLEKTFTPSDTALSSFVEFPIINGVKRTWVDFWGDRNMIYRGKVALYNHGLIVQEKSFELGMNNLDTFLVGTNLDTLKMYVTFNVAANNQKPRLFIDVTNQTNDSVLITITGINGQVHGFMGIVQQYTGHYGAFKSYNNTWATDGDANYTIGEMASAENVIAVGAYTSKVNFRNISGNFLSYSGYATVNQIAPFSSHGPSVDGRVKPDITAPGLTLASAVSSFDDNYKVGGSNYTSTVAATTFQDKTYYYSEAMGTSMSAPMVSGIVALMLQANPYLSIQQVKLILQQTAIKDNFTTLTPDSSIWGYGKINAVAAVKAADEITGILKLNKSISAISLYPNPSNGLCILNLHSVGNTTALFQLLDMHGKIVYELNQKLNYGLNEITLNTIWLKPGVYTVAAKSNQGDISFSRLVIK